jgi:hypothetical protein
MKKLLIFALTFMLLAGTLSAAGLNVEANEFKILLKAEQFIAPQKGCDLFWELVEKVALDHGVKIKSENEQKSDRQIAYLDSKNFDLYKKGFILRLRADMIGVSRSSGQLKAKNFAELTLKFRAPDKESAMLAPVFPAPGLGDDVSCEEDVVIKATEPVSVFSTSGNVALAGPTPKDIAAAIAIFPGLRQLKLDPTIELGAVNNILVVEKRFSRGTMYFNNEKTKTDFSVWYKKGESKPFIAEFSFKLRIGNKLSASEIKAREQIEKFFVDLVKRGKFFIDKGQTKTGAVYQSR